MIAALRRRHRWLMLGLLVVVPLGLLTAVALRPEPVQVGSLPAGLAPPTGPVDVLLGDGPEGRLAVLAGAPVRGGPQLTLGLDAPHPDLLVYATWRADAPGPGPLPADARLVGSLGTGYPRTLSLPPDAAALVVFSPPHGEVLLRIPLTAVEEG